MYVFGVLRLSRIVQDMSRAMKEKIFGAYVDKQGPDQPAHLRNVIWASVVRL